MQKQPLLLLLVSFCAGIFLQEYFHLPKIILYIALAVSALSVFIFFTKSIFLLRLKALFICFMLCCLGLVLHYLQNQTPDFPVLNKEENLIFKLEKKLNSSEKSRKYEVLAWKADEKTAAQPPTFKAVLIIPKSELELNFKHFYKAQAYVSTVKPAQHDYQFHYQRYLNRKGIYHQLYLPKGYLQSSRKHLSFQDEIKQNRLELLQKIDAGALSSQTREILKGIILADRTEMDAELVSDFQRTGLIHILAISGSHIAIIFGIFYFLFLKIFPLQFRKWGIIASLLFIWVFAVFIGMGNSVVRSCIMLSVYFSYVILQRKPDFVHSMSLAVILILVVDSNQIFDVGFQLSFSAVLGIYWFNPVILQWFPARQPKITSLFTSIFSVTTAAQLGTMPFVIYYFHQYSLLSVVANLVVLPVTEVLIISSLVMTFFAAFGWQVSWLSMLFDRFVQATLWLVHWLSSFDVFLIEQIPLGIAEAVVLFISLYYLKFLFQKFTLKNGLKVMYVLVLLISVRTAFYFYYNEKEEILSHQYYNKNVISVKEKGKVTFYMKKEMNTKNTEQFIIKPYLTSRRTADYKLVELPAEINLIKLNGVEYKFHE